MASSTLSKQDLSRHTNFRDRAKSNSVGLRPLNGPQAPRTNRSTKEPTKDCIILRPTLGNKPSWGFQASIFLRMGQKYRSSGGWGGRKDGSPTAIYLRVLFKVVQ
eukprot:364620-Chlamydomonas_euryale.AAC.10